MEPLEIQNAFLNADRTRPKYWHERTWREKLFFWKEYRINWIRDEIIEAALKYPNFLKDLIDE